MGKPISEDGDCGYCGVPLSRGKCKSPNCPYYMFISDDWKQRALEAEATIKAVAEWVKAERDCCPAVNDAISDTRCQPYTNRRLRCPDCPATNVNELQAFLKEHNNND